MNDQYNQYNQYSQYGTNGQTYEAGSAPAPKKAKKKKGKLGFIILEVVLCLVLALAFGIISGVTFLGVSVGGNYVLEAMGIEGPGFMLTREEPTEEPTEEPSEEPTETPSEDISVAGDVDSEVMDNASLTDVSAVVEEVMPSIVSIVVTTEVSFYGYTQDVEGAGSGFIVGQSEDELLIATNYHVIEDGKTIKVQFFNEAVVEASVKGKNISMDLAVLAIPLTNIDGETKEIIEVAKIGDSTQLRVGEPAIAIGNALGYGQSVTTGVISALNRELELDNGSVGTFIQTDAAINPGNSGGALLNTYGEVIGINSNKIGGTAIEGMGYAIPISAASPIIESLINKEELDILPEEEQGYLGISGTTITSAMAAMQDVTTPYGVYISDIVSGSPAALAGLQRGDIITGFEDTLIETMEDLKSNLGAYSAGSTVTITYMRLGENGYEKFTCEVTLTSKPASGQ